MLGPVEEREDMRGRSKDPNEALRPERTAGDAASDHLDGQIKVTSGLGGGGGLIVNRLHLGAQTGL